MFRLVGWYSLSLVKAFLQVSLPRLPDIVVSHHEGLAERLRGVQPHAGVLLHRGRVLPRDGLGTGVEGAGDGGEQGPVGTHGAHTYRAQRTGADHAKDHNRTTLTHWMKCSGGNAWPVSPCKPLGRSMDLTSSSAMSKAFRPLNFFSQNN